MRLSRTSRRGAVAGAATVALGAALAVTPQLGQAAVQVGSDRADIISGRDNDNANNTFIQPQGVQAKQHMDNTDLLVGRSGHDLLIGNLGGDTVLAGRGSDILVGGPERFQAPNGDVLLGEDGDDINLWAPGDGSDLYVGGAGHDTMVFAPFVTNKDGSLKLVNAGNRKVPKVNIDNQPTFSCDIVKVPASQRLGVEFLARFSVNKNLAVTVRQRNVERVLCTSPKDGTAQVADLTDKNPRFRDIRVRDIPGTLGAIVR